MKTLNLTIKKEWFEKIASGEKKNEYRLYKEYWIKRLMKGGNPYAAVREFEEVQFIAGYNRNAPRIRVECLGIYILADGKGTDLNVDAPVFDIRLGQIIETCICSKKTYCEIDIKPGGTHGSISVTLA